MQAARNTLLFPWPGLCFAALGDTEGAKAGEKGGGHSGTLQVEDIFVKYLDACPPRRRGQISLLPLWDLPRASGQGHKDLALHVYLHCDG